MLMHQYVQDSNTGWHGFWNFHDGDCELSGYFESLSGFEYNFQARLDPELGPDVYRGSLFNLDGNADEFEREILLVHQSTHTRDDDSGSFLRRSLWQQVWQGTQTLETLRVRRPLTRMRDAEGRRIYPPGPLRDAYDRPGGTAESVPPSTGNSDES